MTVTLFHETHQNRQGSCDGLARTTSTRSWRVVTDNRYDDDVFVIRHGLSSNLLPQLYSPHPSCQALTARKVTATNQADSPNHFLVTVDYSSGPVEWNQLNSGGKTICLAACVAVGSLFADWVTLENMSLSGVQQGAWLFLLCWIYPVLMLLRGKDINQTAGLSCAAASILAAGCYIQSKSVELLGKTVNSSGGGPALFIFASIALGVGVLTYRRAFPPVPRGGYK